MFASGKMYYLTAMLASLITGFFLLIPNWGLHLYSFDDGTVLNQAWRIYNGQQIYKDFYTNFGPLTLEFYRVIFEIFGVSYVVAKKMSVIFLILATFGIYYIASKITPTRLSAWLATIIFAMANLFSMPSIGHNSLSVYALIIAIAIFYGKNSEKKEYWKDVLIGVIVGSSIFFLLTRGGAGLLIISFLYIHYSGYKPNLNLLVFITSVISILLTGTLYWGLGWITTPLSMLLAYTSVVGYVSWLAFLISTATLLVLGCILYLSSEEKVKKHVIPLTVAGIMLNISVINLPDLQHIISVLFPNIFLFVLVIDKYFAYLNEFNRQLKFFVLLVLFFSTFIVWSISAYDFLQKIHGNHYVNNLKKLVADRSVLVYPYGEAQYFMLQVKQPLDVSVPDFYSYQSRFRSMNVNNVYNNLPVFIIEQTRSLELFNIEDPYVDLKNKCYILIEDYPTEKRYRIDSEKCSAKL